MFRILLLPLLLLSTHCLAYDDIDVELDTETAMNLTRFEGSGDRLLLWLPSERGFGQGYIPVALNLAAMDYDVWAVHLHDTYVIPTGRDSLDGMDPEDLVALIRYASQQGFSEIYLVASSRGAQLALKTSYLWQQQYPSQNILKGLLLFSPHLIEGRTEMGQDASYIEIARHSNLPVYLLQAQYSTKFARGPEIMQQLEQGGSPVYLQVLLGVWDGFHMRPDEDLRDRDLQARAHLAGNMVRAIRLLRQTRAAPFHDDLNKLVAHSSDSGSKAPVTNNLYLFTGEKNPPQLKLTDLKGQTFDLTQTRGKVVLVNFWATWCRPCVEEIPSLSRLVERMQGKPFQVVAINIGESAQDIQTFVNSIPVNFDILLDQDSVAVRDWKVYAYPSNYLLDRQGLIRYAYRGALQWDSPSVVEKIETLF
jgi:thiol-disulfide isomerase/thioredoxin